MVALVLASLGTYVSLMTGLWPAAAFAVLAFWVLLAVICLRGAFAGNERWRVLLPGLFLAFTYLVYGYGLQHLLQEHYKTQGFPRRYYSPKTAR